MVQLNTAKSDVNEVPSVKSNLQLQKAGLAPHSQGENAIAKIQGVDLTLLTVAECVLPLLSPKHSL